MHGDVSSPTTVAGTGSSGRSRRTVGGVGSGGLTISAVSSTDCHQRQDRAAARLTAW
ncbi:hypothetical protein [Micromonospora echinofusca]|uniref:Uncharacterized protein n=1 Tax=Micromonospora echinofusca TaxID=47858 RepID=A0ABS3VS53_MICEH|nr:hypothetical protein [Micromonospora echinofusca]MBO4207229.1 hypothetical protein [Micromonospora echinofusca]